MPIFISYSHSDRAFVNKLATGLVKHNAHVWIDSWELNVGDSILTRVQEAIQEASALLIVLSKASVASEWCKKELNAGLMRELEEKRVLVLPVLIEDCERPSFLKEKVYADFRCKFDTALQSLVDAVANVTTLDQGRMKSDKAVVDWSETWGYQNDLFHMEYIFVESLVDFPFTLLTEVTAICNKESTDRYQQYEKLGLDWVGRMVMTESVTELAEHKEIKLLLKDQHPVVNKYRLQGGSTSKLYDVIVRCRRMGEDNGKDQLVNITNYLRRTREYLRQRARKLSKEELEKLLNIASKD